MSGGGPEGWHGLAVRLPVRIARAFEGIWTVPLALALAGLVLALVVGPLGTMLGAASWVDPDGGRAALSAVAGGVMSVAGIVFSLTFVALSITAQQLSPRILDYVLRGRVTQVLIGLALATFLFAAISLALSSDAEPWRFGVAVPLALGLATATLGAVVIFVHSMTRVMRSEDMVSRLGRAFARAARQLIAGPAGCVPVRLSPGARAVIDEELAGAEIVRAGEAGYVARIDHAGLVRLAAANDLVIALSVRENDHLLPGMPVARVLGLHPDGAVGARNIAALVALTDRRTPAWGADYEAAALSEAALRALSPGINDPASAISCLNLLFEGIAILAADGPPPDVLGDGERVARLVLPPKRAREFLTGAVLPVAVAGQGDFRLRARLEALLGHLAALTGDDEERRAIEAFALRVDAREDDAFSG
ncbi:DUF2254 domain-containing protein [Limibaculum sp. M0105]|uniref:DUF2254 domain-containing protein n=1 Tax=Thermohalobaculum xanthum TaxID=2753746 RepID=A0A8J7SJ37_9RHOB|nr:DUF2254 family protein [Thermohalobaculum xanthum]MBK0400715.1 DUF2254 domain-containing protein [Thermohalobaculum xanthum]